MKPQWTDSANRYFSQNFHSAGSPKWIARCCCEVAAWSFDPQVEQVIVNSKAVEAGLSAYSSLQNGSQPFENLGVIVQTSYPYKAMVDTPVELGRKGGQSTTPAKTEASRTNGKKGGRPARDFSAFD